MKHKQIFIPNLLNTLQVSLIAKILSHVNPIFLSKKVHFLRAIMYWRNQFTHLLLNND